MNARRIRSSVAGALIALVVFAPLSAAQRGGGAPATPPSQANVMIPMRDGVQLGADVYLPAGNGPFPVLLTITPYGKNGSGRGAAAQLAKGYAVVAVDSRGLRASKGKWEPYIHEAQDGFDVQEWVGHQKWCNGNVGMFGTSYPAYTQVAPAQFRSQYVKAIIPVSAQSDNYGSVWGSDGIVHLAFAPRWATEQEAIAEGKPAPQADWNKLAWQLPLKSIPDMTGGVRSQFLADVFTHESHDSFWHAMSIADKYGEVEVPAIHVTGWFDDLSRETQTNFTGFSQHGRTEAGRKAQHLLIGPWGHGVPRFPDGDWIFGDVNFGPDVKIDFQNTSTQWFDHYLKGENNGADKQAPVKIFVMGANKWRDEQEWPLARAKATPYYFHSKGWANSRFGDGVLSTAAPSASESASDKFRYDPRNPVPTYGGHGCCDYGYAALGPLDQKVTEERPDVLVYTTDVLGDDTEVTGIPQVDLVFSTDVTDTDFFATISDVYPDGKSIQVGEGEIRTRFRDSFEKATLLTPNKEAKATIKLWGTSNVFKKGHRIRVRITSSNFPRFARNLNSGKAAADEVDADIKVANTTVFHAPARASAIILPIVPASTTP